MNSQPSMPQPDAITFLRDYASEKGLVEHNPEEWLPARISQDLQPTGDSSLKGRIRNDIKGKIQRGVLRV